mmetsp:Transcript_33130/g.38558  ORF Transcript_33130/g.38558 Transcript_33130/m.38558 type:complete len:82 (+) Transcript_33130:1434-1679(+)
MHVKLPDTGLSEWIDLTISESVTWKQKEEKKEDDVVVVVVFLCVFVCVYFVFSPPRPFPRPRVIHLLRHLLTICKSYAISG